MITSATIVGFIGLGTLASLSLIREKPENIRKLVISIMFGVPI